MNRRSFLFGIFGATGALVIGYFGCRRGETKKNGALFMPGFLSTIMDEGTIKDIGEAYLTGHTAENSAEILKTQILSSFDNKSLSRMETSDAIQGFLEEKIKSDFVKGNTEIVDGWILSQTETRQCALYTVID